MKSKLLAILLFCSCITLSAGVQVIPMPQSVNMNETVFNKDYLDRILYVRDGNLAAEAYEIRILESVIVIKFSDEAGRFYAHQTLNQLAEAEVMYCGFIKDAPRYQWRGLMLDEARHFFGKDQVIKVLDLMARYKAEAEALHSRIAALSRMQEHFDGYNNSVKYVMQAHSQGSLRK